MTAVPVAPATESPEAHLAPVSATTPVVLPVAGPSVERDSVPAVTAAQVAVASTAPRLGVEAPKIDPQPAAPHVPAIASSDTSAARRDLSGQSREPVPFPQVPAGRGAAKGAVIIEADTDGRAPRFEAVASGHAHLPQAAPGIAATRFTAVIVVPDSPDALPVVRIVDAAAPVRVELADDADPAPTSDTAKPSQSPERPLSVSADAAGTETMAPAVSGTEDTARPVTRRRPTPRQAITPLAGVERPVFVDAPISPALMPAGAAMPSPAALAPVESPVTEQVSAVSAPAPRSTATRPSTAPWAAAVPWTDVPMPPVPTRRTNDSLPAPVVAAPVTAGLIVPGAVSGAWTTMAETAERLAVVPGRMMVGAWQQYQGEKTAAVLPLKEVGTVVPPLPVRLLNLALNVAAAGRRLDAPLLDGSMLVRPGLIASVPAPASVAPTVVDSPLPTPTSVPAISVALPASPQPEAPAAKGNAMPQPQVDPVMPAKSKSAPVLSSPESAVTPKLDDVTFSDMVTDDDLAALADWPEEDAIDDDSEPDAVAPETAAAFLAALGNSINPAIVPAFVPTPTVVPQGDSGEVRPAVAKPRRLPLADHMAAVQQRGFVTGDVPVAPAASAPGTAHVPAAARPETPAPAGAHPGQPLPTATAPAGTVGMGPGPTPVVTTAGPGAAVLFPATDDPAEAGPDVPSVPNGTGRPTQAAHRNTEGRRSAATGRPRPEAVSAAMPNAFIPKEAVQQPKGPEPEAARPAEVTAAPSTGTGGSSNGGDGRRDQQQSAPTPAVPSAPTPSAFINPAAFGTQPTAAAASADGTVSGVSSGALGRRMETPNLPEGDGIGPITVRSEAVQGNAPQTRNEVAEAPEAPVFVSTAGMTGQQLIDAVNDGVPLHFAQMPDLVQAIVTTKPFVERTVDVVLQPENLGRIRLEVSLVDNGTAIRIAITTQSSAAQKVMESFVPRIQQIAQGQGYAVKEAEVKVSDRPIRSDSKGQGGSDSAGSRQNRRRRRNNDDGTV